MVKPGIAQRHVVAVMIDDQRDARPQSGLSQASIVWQAPAEGGIPRYMALFHEGDPKAVGPVRSARLYFVQWAAQWQSVYVHVGGSPQALALLHSARGKGGFVYDADEFRWGGKYLWRISQRPAPHNVYSDGFHLRGLAERVGAKARTYKPAWNFAPDAELARRPSGSTLLVPYLANQISYRYDRKSNTWLRTVTGEAKQTDAASKTRIAPKNVVVMYVNFAPLNDGSKKHRLEARVIGSGRALIATNGKTISATWRKTSVTGPVTFTLRNGQPATLTIGQTFVQVVPSGSRVTIKNGAVPAAQASPGASASPSASASASASGYGIGGAVNL